MICPKSATANTKYLNRCIEIHIEPANVGIQFVKDIKHDDFTKDQVKQKLVLYKYKTEKFEKYS